MKTVISKDGTSIAYEQMGSGPALILVDGAMCHRAFGPMRPLSALLEPHFTVYIYDRRGRGESGDTAPYAVEREVEDIEALINLAGGSAFVYGISSGAALALEAALRLSSIKKVALYEPPYNPDVNSRPAANAYLAQLKELLSAGKRGDAATLFMTYVGAPAEAVAGMQQSPIWPMFEAVAPTLAYDGAIIRDGAVPTERAAAVTIPTLIMTGEATIPFMHATAQALETVIPNVQRRVLDGQTHEVAADVLAPHLIEFFTTK